jgi:zinc transporter
MDDIPPAALAALLGPDQHQQLHADSDCVYGVIADLSRSLDGVSEQVGYLHFVMTERRLISARRHALAAVEATRQALRKGRRLSSVASLLELIVEHIAEAIDRLADEIALQMDRIEERILDDDVHDERRNLGIFRRTTVRLHRQLVGLRTLFARLEQRGSDDLNPALRLEAARLSQRLDGLDHEIEALRERARLLQEEVSHQVAEETNRNLRALSIVTILFLPPTLVAGFFGMNLKGMAFAEGEAGFWGGVAVAVLSSAVVFAVLRWLGVTGR